MSKNLERAPFASTSSVQPVTQGDDEVVVSEWRLRRSTNALLLSRMLLLVQVGLAMYMLLAESSARVETRRVLLVLIIVLAFAVGMLPMASASSWSLSVRRDDDDLARIDDEIASLQAEEAKLVAELDSLTGAARESARQRVSVVVARRLKVESLRRTLEDSKIAVGEKVLACQAVVESSPAAFPHAMQVATPVSGFDGIDGATGMPRVSPAAGPQTSAVYDFARQ
jgi:hypothetical protein